MYNAGGWYDIFLQGNIDSYSWLQHQGKRKARGNQKLFMGPFGHGDLSGDLEYPTDLKERRQREELRWFNYWLKGEKNGIMDDPAVTYYMMAGARKGAFSPKNEWRTAADWPPPHTPTPLYLQEEQGLAWQPPASPDAATTYIFDPKSPVPTFGGNNLTIKKGPMDQRAVGERDDYFRFNTEPLTEDVVIAGPVTMDLWVATDRPDTDFMVKLVDVYPDGYEAIVLDNPLRARFRNGQNPEDVAMMPRDTPVKLSIDLWSTALTFEAGHRIGVHITSSNYPRFDVNPNTGVPTMNPGSARNTVFHNQGHPSALLLPLAAEPAAGKN
ncbi:MAG: CocE/NonD family hydrolase [Candidatus Hydrogenedentes bacterium]|nr:CocE/NonD family hydrolase [Candidatus Hydrogenedentota bacterium]